MVLVACLFDYREAAYQFDTYRIVRDADISVPSDQSVLQRTLRHQFMSAINGIEHSFPAHPRIPISEEQAEVIRFDLPNQNDILYVPSFAGTGKTTTILHYALARPKLKVLYISFTKSYVLAAHRHARCSAAYRYHSGVDSAQYMIGWCMVFGTDTWKCVRGIIRVLPKIELQPRLQCIT